VYPWRNGKNGRHGYFLSHSADNRDLNYANIFSEGKKMFLW
jgi:hypothetical protein